MENQIEIQRTSNTPAEMIRLAVAGNADLEKLEKLLAIQERWEANEARKAYHKAMADFKANAPEIDKDKEVSYDTSKGRMKYSHASLYNVTKKISAELSKHGLSASWVTHQNGKIDVTCKITHELGHSEETTLSADSDMSGSKNSIQGIGSTITYLERYTLLALTGLATFDQDDDAQTAEEFITDKQVNEIRDILISLGKEKKEGEFLKVLKAETLEKLPASQYKNAIVVLDAIKEKQQKQEVKK